MFCKHLSTLFIHTLYLFNDLILLIAADVRHLEDVRRTFLTLLELSEVSERCRIKQVHLGPL